MAPVTFLRKECGKGNTSSILRLEKQAGIDKIEAEDGTEDLKDIGERYFFNHQLGQITLDQNYLVVSNY